MIMSSPMRPSPKDQEHLPPMEQGIYESETCNRSSSVFGHPAVTLRHKWDISQGTGSGGNKGENKLPIEDRHELLRRQFINLGIWYEDVDSIIEYCQTGLLDTSLGKTEDFILAPEYTFPLGLHKASCLSPKLGIRDEFMQSSLTPTNNSTHDGTENSSQSHHVPRWSPRPQTTQTSSRSWTDLRPANANPVVVSDRQELTRLRQAQHGHQPTTLERSTVGISFARRSFSGSSSESIARSNNTNELQKTTAPASCSRSAIISSSRSSSSSDPFDCECPTPSTSPGETSPLAPTDMTSNQQKAFKSNVAPHPHIHSPSKAGSCALSASALTPPGRRKGLAWSREEEYFLIGVVRELRQTGTTGRAVWLAAESRMSAQGYKRTSNTIQVRWSIRLGKMSEEMDSLSSPVVETEIHPRKPPCQNRQYTVKMSKEKHSSYSSEQRTLPARPINRSEALHLTERLHAGDISLPFAPLKDESPNLNKLLARKSGVLTPRYAAHEVRALLRSLRFGDRSHLSLRSRSGAHCLRLQADKNLRVYKTWNGASHDILDVAWSPDGTRYVAGTATLMDNHTMQYNRPNNLLLGSLVSDTIRDLPDHHIVRPRQQQTRADSSAYAMLDPKLYMTISAVHWSESGDRLYTASFDQTVKIWNVRQWRTPECFQTLRHEARVDVMAVAREEINLLATGCDQKDNSLRVYRADGNEPTFNHIYLPSQRRNSSFVDDPTCLRFGPTDVTSRYLLAGFGANEMEADGTPSSSGFLGLWRFSEDRITPISLPVSPCSQSIFDIAWSPTATHFATGNSTNRTGRKSNHIRSQVRVYDTRFLPSKLLEYDCPAIDINTVTFCPFDERYITASCTDGSTYVWDYRKPSMYVHRLAHDKPIGELRADHDLELIDVGVRFTAWGTYTDRLLTGGSDGVLKLWDIRKAPADAHVRDVASFEAEVMCGKFSPDKANLLIGDGRGSLHILSKSQLGASEEVTEIGSQRSDGIQSREGSGNQKNEADKDDESTVGRRAATELVESGQIVLHPNWGAGKGPSYEGPFAKWARPPVEDKALPTTALLPEVQQLQLDQTMWKNKRSRPPTTLDDAIFMRREKRQTKEYVNGTGELLTLVNKVETSRDDAWGSCQVNNLTMDDEDEGIDMENSIEEDHWFPPNWAVDANIRTTEC